MMTARQTRLELTTMAKMGLSLLLAGLLAIAFVGVGVQEASAADKPTLTVTNASTGKVALKKGQSYSLGAKASGAKITYKSSKKTVVTVSKKGMLKAKKIGKATITITAKKGSAKVSKKVTVTVLAAKKYKAVKKVTVKAAKKNLLVGEKTKITTSFTPAKASNKNLIYKSSNTAVLTVSAKGAVTAKKAGTAKVTVTSCANKKAKGAVTFTVKVKTPASSTSSSSTGSSSSSSSKPAVVAATAVELNRSEAEIEEGQTVELSASVEPANATNADVTWSTSDETVATVDDGVVTGTGAGLAIITATTDNGVSADCEVHVDMTGAANFDEYLESYSELVAQNDADIDLGNLPDDPYATGRLIVKDDGTGADLNGISPQPTQTLNDGEGLTILQYASASDAQDAAEKIAALQGIEWVDPDMYVKLDSEGDEPDETLSAQADSYLSWGIPVMGLDVMAESLRDKKGGVIIAVLDSGLTPNHYLFKGKIASGGHSFVMGNDNTSDNDGHGTHVAGIIADATQDLSGIKILPVQVSCGLALPCWVAFGVKHAVKHGAKVINMSIGLDPYYDTINAVPVNCINDAVENAVSHGVTVVAAAGNNDGDTSTNTPANCDAAIVVGAVDKDNVRWCEGEGVGSNFGKTLDFMAPGVNILSCTEDGDEALFNKTSAATPHIAAAAAMIKLKHPEYSPYDIENALIDCSIDLGDSKEYGHGLPNLSKIAGSSDGDSSDDSDVDPNPHADDRANGTCGTCLWRIDVNDCLIVGPGKLPDGYEQYSDWPWFVNYTDYHYDYHEINSVIFSSDTQLGNSTAGMFNGLTSLGSVDGLAKLDTSGVKNMDYMFAYCTSLESIQPLSSWNVSNAESMTGMFEGCWSLQSVDALTAWNVSSECITSSMFAECDDLTSYPSWYNEYIDEED